jgi:hypothetical protein
MCQTTASMYMSVEAVYMYFGIDQCDGTSPGSSATLLVHKQTETLHNNYNVAILRNINYSFPVRHSVTPAVKCVSAGPLVNPPPPRLFSRIFVAVVGCCWLLLAEKRTV